MRKPLVVGNWKMHGSRASVSTLLETLKATAPQLQNTEVAVLPPFVFLEMVSHFLRDSTIVMGAQNVCAEETGAFTGEISAAMLADFGCRYILVGHSERRTLYHEDDALIAKKFERVIEAGMHPIVCVGETLAQREADQTQAVITQQLTRILKYPVEMLTQAVIAYEPVWAIGTGKTATPEQAQAVHADIRAQVARCNENLARKIRILYGGSVKGENAEILFQMPDIDGGLVGGASLIAEEFIKICRVAHH